MRIINDHVKQMGLNIDEIFHRFNYDKDQNLDEQEFCGLVKTFTLQVEDDILKYLFLRIDLSGDGFITLKEFKRSLFGFQS